MGYFSFMTSAVAYLCFPVEVSYKDGSPSYFRGINRMNATKNPPPKNVTCLLLI